MGANCVELAPPLELDVCVFITIGKTAATGARTRVARSRHRSLGHDCFTFGEENAVTQHERLVRPNLCAGGVREEGSLSST